MVNNNDSIFGLCSIIFGLIVLGNGIYSLMKRSRMSEKNDDNKDAEERSILRAFLLGLFCIICGAVLCRHFFEQ